MKKVTNGFVVQEYDEKTGRFISQEFVAGDDTTWEDDSGETIAMENHPTEYLNFDMVQPKYPGRPRTKTSKVKDGTPKKLGRPVGSKNKVVKEKKVKTPKKTKDNPDTIAVEKSDDLNRDTTSVT